MRILYFHQHFSTPRGASGTRSYEMAKALVQAGHEVIMICGSYSGGDTGLRTEFRNGLRQGLVDGIQIVEFDLKYSNYMNFLQRSVTFLRFALKSLLIALRIPADVLFATSTPLTAGLPGILARCMKRRRFVFEVRDLWPELPKEMGVITNPLILGGMSLLEKLSYRAAMACIALAPGIAAGIRKRSDPRMPIKMIPNGSDISLFQRPDLQGVPPGIISKHEFLAVFTGAHGIANGLDAVLDAAKILMEKGRNDIKLLFVGDGKLKPGLLARKKKEKLDNCTFMDPIAKAELVPILRSSDAGLMILSNLPAFYYGTSPNKFFDYIAAGLPVINNYPGWLADVIEAKNLGLVVKPDDPIALASALIALADQPHCRHEMGQNALECAKRDFDRKILGKQFVTFIEQMA